jgi:hypothetical protein
MPTIIITKEGKTYDLSIHQNPDATRWAEFFLEHNPNCGLDLEAMRGWFANAMMAMHDHLIHKGAPLNGDHTQYLLDQQKLNNPADNPNLAG